MKVLKKLKLYDQDNNTVSIDKYYAAQKNYLLEQFETEMDKFVENEKLEYMKEIEELRLEGLLIGVLVIKFQISSTKYQTSSNFQSTKFKTNMLLK